MNMLSGCIFEVTRPGKLIGLSFYSDLSVYNCEQSDNAEVRQVLLHRFYK